MIGRATTVAAASASRTNRVIRANLMKSREAMKHTEEEGVAGVGEMRRSEEDMSETLIGPLFAPPVVPDPRQSAVYEACQSALLRKRLVLTPYMLVDRLNVCADLASEACCAGSPASPQTRRIEQIGEEIAHMLHLLHRGGLWADTKFERKEAVGGRAYFVITEPFMAPCRTP